MISVRAAAAASLLIVCSAGPAFADLTAFVGANTVPVNRAARGLAVGVGLMIAIEFEYAETVEDPDEDAPGLRTGTVGALAQLPFAISGVQPYAVVSVGLFRERLDEVEENGLAVSAGGGIKVRLAGPIRLRIDYRGFRLRGAEHSPAHRVYAGLNLAF